MSLALKPIGIYRGSATSPALAPRQGVLTPEREGLVDLDPSMDPQCLRDLEGFERIWLIFQFDRNATWKPLVLPPHQIRKRGVFATRSPYRPNPIGLSSVSLVGIKGRRLRIKGADLLDGTPILDIKPYIAYADSFPNAKAGWVDEADIETPLHTVILSPVIRKKILSIEESEGVPLEETLRDQLSRSPTLGKAKRIKPHATEAGRWVFAWKRWRFEFSVKRQTVRILGVSFSDA